MHLNDMQPKIGIIGGTGVYPDKLEIVNEIDIQTPYGSPSSSIAIGVMNGIEVAFLPRHGKNHTIPPHMINYRANIYALKQLGIERIISPCAVGSLKEEYKPGDMVIVDQFIDFTKSRKYTFFDGPKTEHIAIPDPFCPELNQIAEIECKNLKINSHNNGTCVCIEGPRFSTRAESKMFRQFADIISMTIVPECQLAREMNMCYMSLATITDYDAWSEETVDAMTVSKVMEENSEKIRNLLGAIIPKIPVKREKCNCPKTLESSAL